jgi:predicted lipoprotein with Yx(FWY)xxD motif
MHETESLQFRPAGVAIAFALATIAAGAVFFLLNPATGSAGYGAPAATTVVSASSSSLGRILVTSNGHTLYLFERHKHGKSACVGKCVTFWPPLIAKGKPRAAGGARASLLGTTKRSDGRMQVTYNQHPLYTFVKDKKKGQTNGEGLDAFGAEWYAVSPAGAKVDDDS